MRTAAPLRQRKFAKGGWPDGLLTAQRPVLMVRRPSRWTRFPQSGDGFAAERFPPANRIPRRLKTL